MAGGFFLIVVGLAGIVFGMVADKFSIGFIASRGRPMPKWLGRSIFIVVGLCITGMKGTTASTYASSITYAAQGAIQQINRGDTLFETTGYNSRLRPISISLGPSAGSATVAGFNLS